MARRSRLLYVKSQLVLRSSLLEFSDDRFASRQHPHPIVNVLLGVLEVEYDFFFFLFVLLHFLFIVKDLFLFGFVSVEVFWGLRERAAIDVAHIDYLLLLIIGVYLMVIFL